MFAMNSDDEESQGPGIIISHEVDNLDELNTLAHSVLDEVLANIIHDIVLKAHREEKVARANTAAILIEAIAATTEPPQTPSTLSSTNPHVPHLIETESARYDDGEVYLRGNPLETVREIRCAKCGLQKVLDPTDGVGAKPLDYGDGTITYCKRHPYISRAGHDIYGLPFPTEDSKAPRKSGKPKPSSSQPLSQSTTESFESPAPEKPEANARPSFPTTNCSRCSRHIPVREFRKHLMACMGISSRSSGRAAVIKASSTFQHLSSSQNGSTPPASRKGTPVINPSQGSNSERFGNSGHKDKEREKKTSPMKRSRNDYDSEASELSMEDYSDASPKKKKKKAVSASSGSGIRQKVPTIKISNNSSSKLSSGHYPKSNSSHSSSHSQPRSQSYPNNGHGQSIGNGNKTSSVPRVSSGSLFNGRMGKLGKPGSNVKKWKSGKITVDGRRLEGERDRDGSRERGDRK